MDNGSWYFPGVTLLITHYNRSGSLERLLTAMRTLGCRFDEIVVSDDVSRPEHLEKLKAMQPEFNYRLVSTEKNSGVAGNMNTAQDAVNTAYTLYVQEDFVPSANFPAHFADALEMMNKDASLDYIRFWSHYLYPGLKPYSKGFSTTVYNPWSLDHRKFFAYSDNPHLRRKTFFEKFGRYHAGIDGNIAEQHMSFSFMQKKGKGLFYEAHETLFDHLNPPGEPSTYKRANWRQGRNPAVLLLRWVYLKYKFVKCVWELKFKRF